MSPRTAKYVVAMIRENDDFDYNQWLKRVREEEAEAKQATGTPGEEAAAKINRPVTTPEYQLGRPNLPLRLATKTLRPPRALRRLDGQIKSQTPKARLKRWLEKVRRACEHFQSSRKRDAVYEFLAPVFDIVMHYKVRRRTTKLLRHAFGFAGLPFDKHADPFSAVIRCTSGNTADIKMISKYARALRYVDQKRPSVGLKRFMKAAGGINRCAALSASRPGNR